MENAPKAGRFAFRSSTSLPQARQSRLSQSFDDPRTLTRGGYPASVPDILFRQSPLDARAGFYPSDHPTYHLQVPSLRGFLVFVPTSIYGLWRDWCGSTLSWVIGLFGLRFTIYIPSCGT